MDNHLIYLGLFIGGFLFCFFGELGCSEVLKHKVQKKCKHDRLNFLDEKNYYCSSFEKVTTQKYERCECNKIIYRDKV